MSYGNKPKQIERVIEITARLQWQLWWQTTKARKNDSEIFWHVESTHWIYIIHKPLYWDTIKHPSNLFTSVTRWITPTAAWEGRSWQKARRRRGRVNKEWVAWPRSIWARKAGILLLFVHHPRLNAFMEMDSLLVPYMITCIDSRGPAALFSTLHGSGGYWQTDLDEADRDKTEFVTHSRLYRYMRRPFGLWNVLGTFQGMKNIIIYVKW